jgi:hypothetical protein
VLCACTHATPYAGVPCLCGRCPTSRHCLVCAAGCAYHPACGKVTAIAKECHAVQACSVQVALYMYTVACLAITYNVCVGCIANQWLGILKHIVMPVYLLLAVLAIFFAQPLVCQPSGTTEHISITRIGHLLLPLTLTLFVLLLHSCAHTLYITSTSSKLHLIASICTLYIMSSKLHKALCALSLTYLSSCSHWPCSTCPASIAHQDLNPLSIGELASTTHS